MKVLWFVPITYPNLRTRNDLSRTGNGWWLDSLITSLKTIPGLELGVVWSSRMEEKLQQFSEGGVTYISVPENLPQLKNFGRWGKLLESSIAHKYFLKSFLDCCVEAVDCFLPDVIHVHGFEKPYGLIAPRVDVPVVLSIQGIMSAIVKVFFGRYPSISSLTDVNLLTDYLLSLVKSGDEKGIIKVVRYFMGRTEWDHAQLELYNPGAEYFHCGEVMRPAFYLPAWDLRSACPHQICTTSSALPYKGLDVLLDAMEIVRRQFKDTTLIVCGEIPQSGYGKYLRNKVSAMKLDDCVSFKGWLGPEMIVQELLNARVFVLPSLIENSPNALAEAQLVGTPAIASSVGGIPSMIIDGTTGLLNHPADPGSLADKITELFNNDELAQFCSTMERKAAAIRHEPTKVISEVVSAYENILMQDK